MKEPIKVDPKWKNSKKKKFDKKELSTEAERYQSTKSANKIKIKKKNESKFSRK